MLQKLLANLDDILVLIGCGLAIYATWLLNAIAALYVTALFCIVGGILIGKARGGAQ